MAKIENKAISYYRGIFCQPQRAAICRRVIRFNVLRLVATAALRLRDSILAFPPCCVTLRGDGFG